MVNKTTDLIKIKDIKDDIIIMEDGSLRALLAIPGVNFSLLGEKEQSIIIYNFKELLDGIDFQLQVLVISRLAYIEKYINYLEEILEKEYEPLIKIQLEEYIKFIKDYVENHLIMKKMFFLIIPYETETISIKEGLLKKEYKQEESYIKKLEQLETRVTYITEKLSIIGLQPIRLTTPELIQLIYEAYNPSLRWGSAPLKLFEELLSQLENET
jgi:type IV secretory pathway VirB4 component